MQQAIAKEKPREAEVGATNCLSPSSGQEIVPAYITGELSDDQRREFVEHIGECGFCLEQIVLWRMAEVAAEVEEETPRPESAHKAVG